MSVVVFFVSLACVLFVCADEDKTADKNDPLKLEDKLPTRPSELEKMKVFYAITCLSNKGKPIDGLEDECVDLKKQVEQLQAAEDAKGEL